MYLREATVKAKGRTYSYLQICETVRVGRKNTRKVLGHLGRSDQLDPKKLDGLIQHLRRYSSPEVQAYRPLSELEILSAKEYGAVLVCRRLWEMLGLEEFLAGQPEAIREAIFRLVSSRLLEPQSKLATSEWQDSVYWPSQASRPSYDGLLAAMDALLPLKAELEEKLFQRYSQDLFSLNLRFVLYDLTSSYFEDDGVCELAEFGYSRDHRPDRRQVMWGMAITPEGLPISQRVFPGNTGDSKTVIETTQGLRERFGLAKVMIVADQGMFSAENALELEAAGQPYLLAIKVRSMKLGEAAVKAAAKLGLPRPKDPGAEWSVREVGLENGRRHIVVFSAFKAQHDRVVRLTRLQKTRTDLRSLARHAAQRKLKRADVIATASRVFAEHETGQYFGYLASDGGLSFWLERATYRRQRRLDGIFILQTNQDSNQLSPQEAVAAYRQLMEVERAFRLIKSPVIKVRPIFHWSQRRVEAHLFICHLAFLLAKALELKLGELPEAERDPLSGEPERKLTATRALTLLRSLKVVEHRWQEWDVAQLTVPSAAVKTLLGSLDLKELPKLLSIRRLSSA